MAVSTGLASTLKQQQQQQQQHQYHKYNLSGMTSLAIWPNSLLTDQISLTDQFYDCFVYDKSRSLLVLVEAVITYRVFLTVNSKLIEAVMT